MENKGSDGCCPDAPDGPDSPSPSQREMLIGGNLVRNFRRNDIHL